MLMGAQELGLVLLLPDTLHREEVQLLLVQLLRVMALECLCRRRALNESAVQH